MRAAARQVFALHENHVALSAKPEQVQVTRAWYLELANRYQHFGGTRSHVTKRQQGRRVSKQLLQFVFRSVEGRFDDSPIGSSWTSENDSHDEKA
jgi:hypothetical protein